MYVPRRLVRLIKRAVKNGRRIEELLYQIGPALIRDHRKSRAAMKTSKESLTSTKSGTIKKNTKTES